MNDVAEAGTTPHSHTPPASPYELLGGGPVIASIVSRFYDLVEHDPAYAPLRAMHARDLGPVRESLTGFLTGWTGGPRDWFDRPGAPCMMSLHSKFDIPATVAEQWCDAMRTAIAGEGDVDPQLARSFAGALERMARAMVSRPT